MGKHSTPRGEYSTMQASQSARGEDTGGTHNYQGQHRQENRQVTAGHDDHGNDVDVHRPTTS